MIKIHRTNINWSRNDFLKMIIKRTKKIYCELGFDKFFKHSISNAILFKKFKIELTYTEGNVLYVIPKGLGHIFGQIYFFWVFY